jgi:hypothetical protein
MALGAPRMPHSGFRRYCCQCFVLGLALLFVHSFKLATISVDSTSILLLIVILISPFISSVTKIKYGDFEAEIDPKEIEQIKAESERSVERFPDEREHRPRIFDTTDSIQELAESDPIIALAKVRIELEKALGRFARATEIETKSKSLGLLVKKLSHHELVTHQMGKSLSEVISICNRTIHGELISDESAETIVDLGVELILDLYFLIQEQTISGSIVDTSVITPNETDELYLKKKYRLTSITPLVENPKRIVRELTQEQLGDLLEDYVHYAEFIVELVEIP